MSNPYLPTKKIAAVSLSGDKRVIALSAYKDGVLSIQKMDDLKGLFSTWRKVLGKKIEAYRKAGFSIYIESDNYYFEDMGLLFRLDEIDENERRTYQNIALDNYYNLIAMGEVQGDFMGNIRLQKGYKRHWITGNTVNRSQDERGRNKYDIEGNALTGHHRALLISVLGATHFVEQNENDMASFIELVGAKQEKSAVDRMSGIFSERFK